MTYNPAEISQNISKIDNAVANRKLHEAFIFLRHHASNLGDWHVTEMIDRLEEDYRLMLDYMTKGVNDPQREKIYETIVGRLLSLSDRITHRLKKAYAPEIYYSTLRFEALQKTDTLQSLSDRYRKLTSDLSFATIAAYSSGDNEKLRSLQLEATELERRIFNRIWVMYPLSDESTMLISSLLDASSGYPPHFRQIVVSALLLGLIQFHDEPKLSLLLDLYGKEQRSTIGIHALCAALIDMFLHRDRIMTDRLINRVMSLRDTTTWTDDVKTIFMQFLRSRDTERINRELHDKVLPELMKLKPEMTKRLNSMNIELGNLEDNPEWEDMLERSGIADKLKKMQEMLEDGGDIFMSAFSSLKSGTFFNEPANWFSPYRASHPALHDNEPSVRTIYRLLESATVLCDSDKYSIAFALRNIPAEQREILRTQLDNSTLAAMELQTSEMTNAPKPVARTANNYISSIYRFFKLFRRRGDFRDPFAEPLDLPSLPLLEPEFNDIEMLRIVAEFYFKRGYYTNAYNVYSLLEQHIGADCSTYQKMGYCLQKNGQYAEALAWYQKAEILDNKNIWTLRRMAACYSASGHTRHALECLNRIADQRPDDLSVTMSIGHCYLELEQPEKALKQYFKVEYLDQKSDRALRPIAWSSFLIGNKQQAVKYYEKILRINPNATDYLNAGHVQLSLGNIQNATALYSKAIELNNGDSTKFLHELKNDTPTLIKTGVDPRLPSLLADAMLYRKNSTS